MIDTDNASVSNIRNLWQSAPRIGALSYGTYSLDARSGTINCFVPFLSGRKFVNNTVIPTYLLLTFDATVSPLAPGCSFTNTAILYNYTTSPGGNITDIPTLESVTTATSEVSKIQAYIDDGTVPETASTSIAIGDPFNVSYCLSTWYGPLNNVVFTTTLPANAYSGSQQYILYYGVNTGSECHQCCNH